MTDRGAHNLNTGCPKGAHIAGAALIGIWMAASVSAQAEDTFEVFEARCLTPMAEVRNNDTSGLHMVAEDDGSETWMAPSREWQLVRSTTEAVVQFCAVHGTFGVDVDAWVEAAIADERYIRIDRVPETLQSTTWREPLIEVEIERDTTPMRLTVVETNLES